MGNDDTFCKHLVSKGIQPVVTIWVGIINYVFRNVSVSISHIFLISFYLGKFTKSQIHHMEITKTDAGFNYKRTTESRKWEDKMYLFPIPITERMKNPNLEQNPGW